MQRLPFDIIINHIIPYTYNIQPKLLLEDIKNYYEIKTKLMNYKYNTNMIKHEILAVFYDNKPLLNKILYRHFMCGKKYFDCDRIYSNNARFNILFGLFTKEERQTFFEYILQDDIFWILKNRV